MLILPDSISRIGQAAYGLIPSAKWLAKGLELVFMGDQVVWSRTGGGPWALTKTARRNCRWANSGASPDSDRPMAPAQPTVWMAASCRSPGQDGDRSLPTTTLTALAAGTRAHIPGFRRDRIAVWRDNGHQYRIRNLLRDMRRKWHVLWTGDHGHGSYWTVAVFWSDARSEDGWPGR